MTEGLNSNNKESNKYLPQFADPRNFFLLQIFTCFIFSTCPQLQEVNCSPKRQLVVGEYLGYFQHSGRDPAFGCRLCHVVSLLKMQIRVILISGDGCRN